MRKRFLSLFLSLPHADVRHVPGSVHGRGMQERMTSMDRQSRWDEIYATKSEREVSWFQETPAVSLDLLSLVGATNGSAIIDIGGGASRLVDSLLTQGYNDLTVLDLSATALAATKARIGRKADRVQWIAADVTTWEPVRTYDVWHDRAALHFLTDEADRGAYVSRLRRALRAGGYAIIGTFAPDGPAKCSGLPVVRYSAQSLGAILGPGFALLDNRPQQHTTPWGTGQQFQFSAFRFVS
jgi:SAM-dependent methyltransferase